MAQRNRQFPSAWLGANSDRSSDTAPRPAGLALRTHHVTLTPACWRASAGGLAASAAALANPDRAFGLVLFCQTLTEMDLFVNCAVSAEVVSCHELGGPSSDGKVRDPNILKSIELDRKSGRVPRGGLAEI